jgi:hypothetical protein
VPEHLDGKIERDNRSQIHQLDRDASRTRSEFQNGLWFPPGDNIAPKLQVGALLILFLIKRQDLVVIRLHRIESVILHLHHPLQHD